LKSPAFLAAVLLVATAGQLAGADERFVVIANASVPGTTVRRADLAAVFLRKANRWGDGSVAVPIDQSGTSPVREAFSGAVLQMPAAAVVQYWQRRILADTSVVTQLPSVKSSDTEVLASVTKTRGSVAYVSAGTALPDGVRALTVVD
jgi:ABC-type phosphate transport system substrate-binding protein